MISPDTDRRGTLLHELSYLEIDATVPIPGTMPRDEYSFALDFDSSLAWPDCPFDTTAAESRYPEASRVDVASVIAEAMGMMSARAPKAAAFVERHLKHAIVRQTALLAGASSSSNRAWVGYCTLTNIHMPADRLEVCIEALVHESVHQFLYRLELDDGNFCDLAETRRFRSPWSGNRIPLHSLIHASFVWFGLSTLWTQLALTAPEGEHDLRAKHRLAASLFGFTFLPELMHSNTFPRAGVEPRIFELLAHMAEIAPAAARPFTGQRTLGEALRPHAAGPWLAHLKSRLEHVDRCWH